MRKELLRADLKGYKVNMHCHTNISDGKQTPEAVKEFYKSNGYSAVCYTDHEILIPHNELCDEDFIALHGYEVAIKKDLSGHTANFMPVYHFNMIAKSQDTVKMPRYFVNNSSFPGNSREWSEKYAVYDADDTIETTHYDIEWINDYLKAVKEGGFLINYNHPEWSLQTVNDYIGLENLHSIEIANGGCLAVGDYTSLHYQQMLRAGKRLVPTAGDDNHNEAGGFRCWTVLKAKELTYESLIEAYESGSCYASEGPEIHCIALEDGKIKIDCSLSPYVYVRSEGRYAPFKKNENGFTHVEFEYNREKMGAFFRVEVRGFDGGRAISNAYFAEDFN